MNRENAKSIIKTTVPITIVGILLPFSQVIDSILTINIISGYRNDATALFGLLSGVVMTVINLPVSICYGLGSVAIPSISNSASEEQKTNRATKILLLTCAVALPCFIGLAIFAPQRGHSNSTNGPVNGISCLHEIHSTVFIFNHLLFVCNRSYNHLHYHL